ncbi:MAG TPA: RNA methyltransferase PUA domain-containing protein, partial [bacterium]|nr:RNA methyltransferase PUA domain-containing protein [bacterium]
MNGRFAISGEEAAHISLAMRCRPGERIRLFDGTGKRYEAEIGSLKRDIVEGRIIGELQSNEPSCIITLCFSPVSRDATEEI